MKLTRITALAVALALVVSLFSCGEKPDGGEKPEHVWSAQSIDTPDNFVPDGIFITGGGLVVTGETFEETDGGILGRRMIIKTDKKNKVVYSDSLGAGDYGYVLSTAGYPDGRALLLARRYDEATKEITFSLLVWDEGKITALSGDISGMLDDRRGGEMFPAVIAADGDGRIYFADGYLIRVFDRSLSLLSDIECGFSVDRMTTLSDGRVAASGYDDYGVGNVYYINPESSDGDVFAVPSGYTGVPGAGGVWLRNNEALFAGDPPEIILDWINSDVIASQISETVVIDKERIAVALTDRGFTSGGEVLVMEKLPENKIPEKILLTLAVGAADYDFPADVVRFNRLGGRYRVVLRYYTGRDENGVFTGEEELKKALSGGDAPDIIRSSDFELTGDLALSGNLIDIGKTLDGNGYAEKLLDCFRGGEMYELPVSFGVRTLVSKASEAHAGMSVSDFISLGNGLSDGKYLFVDAGRDEVLDMTLRCALGEYVDFSTGECDFAVDDFRDILAFAAGFADSWRYEDTLSGDALTDYRDDRDSVYRDGKLVFLDCDIYSPGDIAASELPFGGDETVVAGYPTADGSVGAVTEPGMSFAVMSSSEHAEGAAEFLMFMLDSADYSFSPLTEKFDAALERLIGTTFFTTGNGYTSWPPDAGQEYIDMVTGGEEGIRRTFGESDAEALRELVKSAGSFTGRERYLTGKVLGMIREEAEMYFEGSKSIDETINVIAGRVGVYVSEKR